MVEIIVGLIYSVSMLPSISRIAVGLALLSGCFDESPSTRSASSDLITNPSEGGPFGSAETAWCSNLPRSYCFVLNGPPPKTSASEVVAFMDAAATNWGCVQQNRPPAVVAVAGGFVKSYGVTGDAIACGRSYWNDSLQAAYFVPATDRQCSSTSCAAPLPLNNTSSRLLAKYDALGAHDGVLGLPVSNPVLYGWNATTYQLFTGGIITYRSGQPAAYYAGGSGSRKVVTNRYLSLHNVGPRNGAPIYGLNRDIADTCLVAGQLACTSIDDIGDRVEFWDDYWGAPSHIVARDTWTQAFHVGAPMSVAWDNNRQLPIYAGGTPWTGSTLGFPLADVTTMGTAANGQAIQMQQFERGAVSWQPKGCPTAVKTCPAAGPSYCTTYGSRSSNNVAAIIREATTPLMTSDQPAGFCAPADQLAPTCSSESWIRYSAQVRYKFKCASAVAHPLTILLQIQAPGGWWYDLELPSSAYKEWLLGGDVNSAITYWGIPSETAAHKNEWGQVDWIDFPNGRLYTGVRSGQIAGVHKGIWAKYQEMGAHNGVLGWPASTSVPFKQYPRYQYFEGGYYIQATSDTSATVTALFDDCTLVCQRPSRLGDPTVACRLGGQPSTCGDWGRSTGDVDLDAIPDGLELALIERFRPWMRGQCSTAFTQAYGVLSWNGDCSAVPASPVDGHNSLRRNGGRNAAAVVRYTNNGFPRAENLRYTVHSTWDGDVDRGFNCGKKGQPDGSPFEDKRCIEIIYTTPYNWDLGDPETGLRSHLGDAEIITVLVARRDPYSYNRPPRWGKNLGQATSASDWHLIKSFGSAHLGEDLSESSSFRTYTRATDATPSPQEFVRVTSFVARGKNGNYWFDSDCDNGGYWFDDCDDTTVWQLNYLNAGEELSHPRGEFPGSIIHRPANAPTMSAIEHAREDYSVWSLTDSFTSTGMTYGQQLRRGFMMWAVGGVQYQVNSGDGLCTFVQQPPPISTIHGACYNPEDPWW